MVQPASVALRPLLVPVELRGEAAGLFSSLTSGAMVAGPVLGGLLVASLGPTWGFVAVGAGSFWSAAWMARVRTRPKPRERESSFLADLAEGAGVVRRVAWLVAGLVSAAAFHLGTGLLIVLLEVTVVRDLGGPSALGWVVGLQGVGGVVGGLIAMRWLGTRLLARGFAMLALTPLLPFALAWPGTLWAVMLGAALSQLGIMAFSVAWDVALQDGIEHRHLARVASWDQLVSFVALPVGAGLAGVVASGARPEVVFTGLGLWLGVAGLIPLAVPAIWRLRRVTVTSPGGR